MMKRSIALTLPVALSLGFACGDDTSSLLTTPEQPTPEQPPVVVEPSTPEPEPLEPDQSEFLNGCELERWSAISHAYGIIPGAPQFSPNGGLVTHPSAIYLAGAEFLRRSDASQAGALISSPTSRSRDWDWTVRRGDISWVIERRSDGRRHELSTRAEIGESIEVGITPNGSRMVVLRIQNEAVTIDVRVTETLELLGQIDITDLGSQRWRDIHRFVQFNEQHMFVLTDIGVSMIDLDASVITQTVQLADSANTSFGEAQVISAAVDPAGQRLAVSTAEGLVHILSTENLSAAQAPIASTFVFANENIYAPRIAASPLSWSPNGRALAHLDPAGDLAVRNLASDTVVWTAPAPSVASPHSTSSALGVGFTPEGNGIVIAYQDHSEGFDCAGTQPETLGDLAFTVSGPDEVRLGDQATFELTVENAPDFWVSQITGEVQQFSPASTPARIVWNAHPEGEVVLQIQVDDGLRRGIIEHTIMVLPRE